MENLPTVGQNLQKKLTESSAGDSDEESEKSPIYKLNFSYHGYGSDVPGPWS